MFTGLFLLCMCSFFSVEATRWISENEQIVLDVHKALTHLEVERCGLVVDPNHSAGLVAHHMGL